MPTRPRHLALAAVATLLAACSSGNGGTTGATGAGPGTGATGSATQGATTATGATSGTPGTSAAGTTSGATSSTSSGSSGNTGATTSGMSAPYQPFDGGPHSETLPNAAAADAGCTFAKPILTDAGFCAQCLSDSDCPAPTVCEQNPGVQLSGTCVPCSTTEPTCPAGLLCDVGNTDTCVPDCSQGSSCLTAFGGYCNLDAGLGDIGCVVGCRTNADCPAAAANCDPDSELCAPCIEGATGGCPTGQLCGYDVNGNPGCITDCRANPSSCLPGICDADAGSGSIQCLGGECITDADCAGSSTPHCTTGFCAQCAADSDCQALGIGTPICDNGSCDIYCGSDLTGCGTESCVDAGQLYTCQCGSDQDCAGQAHAPQCIPIDADAGLDGGAGLFGECGCSLGGCGTHEVCESRFDVLELLYPTAIGSLCLPSCNGGQLACANDPSNSFCNSASGYCVACTTQAQCSADAGTPSCIAFDAGLPTGGGQCGCTAAACGGGDVCDLTYGFGYCHSPCSYSSDGYDTCIDGSGFPETLLCNSETGLCQSCFQNSDCLGQSSSSPTGAVYALNFCSDAGSCYGCNTSADCPASAPGCSQGVCGACVTDADCASGYSCSPWGSCLTTCTGGGDQCAPDGGDPLCLTDVCVQCASAADCDGGVEGPGFCDDGTCFFGFE